MLTHMMSVGEETGGLDEMLAKAADFLDGEIERTVETLTSLLEPLLIVVLGGAVGRHGHLPVPADVQGRHADQPGPITGPAGLLGSSNPPSVQVRLR